MSNANKTGDPSPVEDALWAAEGDGQADVHLHEAEDPHFDNAEGRESVHEASAVDDAQFSVPRDEAPAKKKSSVAFYSVLGIFALAAVGVVGYKTGLIGGASKKPLEPITLAQNGPGAMTPAAKSGQTDSMFGSGATSHPGDPLSGNAESNARSPAAAPAGRVTDMEAELFGDAPAAPPASTPPVIPASPIAAAPSAPEAQTTSPAKEAPVAQAPVARPVVVEPQVPAVKPAAPIAPIAATAPAAAKASEAPKTKRRGTRSTPVVVATAKAAEKEEAPKPVKVAVRKAKTRPVVVARAHKGNKPSESTKDIRADTAEVLTGWKLRGTWPSHGPSQRAWISDEQGRVTTVAVGQYVSGAKVIAIGKRGDLVQTTAGQIVP